MKQYQVSFLSIIIMLCLVVLAACGGGGCPESSSGTNGGSSSGTGSGVGGSGSACTPTGGGGGGGTGSTTTAFFYYFDGSNIQGASLSSAGTFASVSSFAAPAISSSSVSNMVIVNKKFLYVPVTGLSEVLAFSIDHTSGALTPVSGSPFSALQSGAETAVADPSGRFLFVGGRYASSVAVYQINSTSGVLTPVSTFPFSSGGLAFSLAVEGAGKFLYVGQGNSTNPVAVFSINQSTGALTEISSGPFPLGVGVVQTESSGKFLFGAADNILDQHLYVFSIDSTTGVPTAVSGPVTSAVSIPFALSVHPSGKFIYASVANNSNVVQAFEGYQLNATTGVLTALSGSPFTSFPAVANCQFEQSGKYAFCQSVNGFSVLNVDTTTGALSHTITDLTAATNLPFAVTD